VLVPVGELERLEHLCRYITRPPLATQRLALAPNGRVIYGLKRHWRDGTSAVSFDPLTFIERLAALVPPPRAHQLAYHGVLATASAWRDLVVPKRAPLRCAPSHREPPRHARIRRIARARCCHPLALVALNLGGATATSLRRRRPDLPPLRRPSPPHRTAHRPGGRAQDPWQLSDCPPSLHGPRRPARANSSTSPESPAPSRRQARSSPATPRERVGPLVPQAPAPRPERAFHGERVGPRGPLDGSAPRDEPPPRGR
jgi:hypothetical protein